ncbi:MAG: hypothetical protein V7K32_15195 [Nostoc sp.]|uniref:hypothetical protein n=1 Tax=Nostoc sp. TaxID=1180 RepID=UPI002FFA9F2F
MNFSLGDTFSTRRSAIANANLTFNMVRFAQNLPKVLSVIFSTVFPIALVMTKVAIAAAVSDTGSISFPKYTRFYLWFLV